DPAGNNGTIVIGSSGSQTSAGTCNSGNSAQAWNNGTNGKRGASLNFDGTDDYVLSTSQYTVSNLSNISISAWVKRTGTSLGSLPGIVAYGYGDEGTNPRFILY
ncbi:MAG TPA: hypothetical protein PLS49_06350, partial [Candidatus Woesebacteria bacterium]|nr:hypothetical protein [Candidatus Woesebacteria bacterium]